MPCWRIKLRRQEPAWRKTPRRVCCLQGVAMNDQTTAFRNDVLLAESVARKVDPKAIVFKLVNPVPGQDADLPYATRENIANVLQKLAELALPQD